MKPHIHKIAGLLVAAAAILTASCGVQTTTQPDGSQTVTVSLLGNLFSLTFGEVGIIEARIGDGIVVPIGVRLFDQTPSTAAEDMPQSAQMILPTSSVGVGQRLANAQVTGNPLLPLNGEAAIRFSVAAGQSATLCDTATFLAEFPLSLQAGELAVTDEIQDLSTDAISVLMANDVTICAEVTTDFDVDLTIGDVFISFGGRDRSELPPPAITWPPSLTRGEIQVPIDNRAGNAVPASATRSFAGVSYAVVGVLEDQAGTGIPAPVTPSSITINPYELGLERVSTLFLGLHSSFVPDVADGAVIATLTITYYDLRETDTVVFTLGENASEWSYDRAEHVTLLGGVQHLQAPVLYSFDTMLQSATPYKGYSYRLAVPLNPFGVISGMSLELADPDTYGALRSATSDVDRGRANHAITAVTLVGPPYSVIDDPATEACCLQGECYDAEVWDCLFRVGGTPLGEGTTCETSSCPTRDDSITEACCNEDGTCDDLPPRECLERFDSLPAGPGTTCANHQCTQACCFDIGVACEDMVPFRCESLVGFPAGEGTTCADNVCEENRGCCLPDGSCEDADPVACAFAGGAPADTQGLTCDNFAINNFACVDVLRGACCLPDGCCDDTLTRDECDAAGGTFQGEETTCFTAPCPTQWACYRIANFPGFGEYLAVLQACSIDDGYLLRDFPGGGTSNNDPAALADDLAPDSAFATRSEAAEACCASLSDFEITDDGQLTAQRNGATVGVSAWIYNACQGRCIEDGNCNTECPLDADPDCQICDEDGLCNESCPESRPDPDCTMNECMADGICNEDCPATLPDPDCGEVCEADGFCNENCSDLTPDPDCDDQTPDDQRQCTALSDFSFGDEGWTVLGDAQGGRADPDFYGTDGNPGGHISAVDDALGGIWYFRAASKFHGNFSDAYGRTLSFDMKVSVNSLPISGVRDVIIVGSEGTIWFDTPNDPGQDWTAYTITLSAGAGWLDDSDNPASEQLIRAVLGNIDDIQIRGEYQNGSDIGYIDNIRLEAGCTD